MEQSIPQHLSMQAPQGTSEDEPGLSSGMRGGRLELVASGRWTAAHAESLETLIDGVARTASGGGCGAIDMGRVSAFDTYGATARTLRTFIASYQELLAHVTDALIPNPDIRR